MMQSVLTIQTSPWRRISTQGNGGKVLTQDAAAGISVPSTAMEVEGSRRSD